MATVLQIINPDDTTQILFDLNDTAGTNSALYGSVKTTIFDDVDLGSAKLDSNAPDIGRALAFNRSSFADLKFRLRIYNASSYDNLNKALGVLSGFLADGCVMKWIPNGSSQTRYIDVLPSSTPVLLDGKELSLYTAFQLFDTPEGVEISLQRLGYVRKAKLDPTANLLLNPTLLRDSNADSLPDSWTKFGTPTLSIVAASEALHVVSTTLDHGVYQATGAASASVGQVWTASAEMKVTSGTAQVQMYWRNAASGIISTITSTTTSASWTRVTLTGTAPALTDHIVVLLDQSGATACTFDVRNAQLELASSASEFRVKVETMNVDPAATGMAQFMPVYNPSDAPAPCEITTAFPDSSSKIVEVDYALISERGVVGSRALSDFLNGPAYAQAEVTGNGWTVTLGTATTNTADVNASGGNVARVTYTAGDASTQLQRVKWTRTTLLDSMRGRFKVYARVKGSSSIPYNMQLRWGAGTVAGETNAIVVHDLSSTPAAGPFHYAYLDLGDIELPRERNITIGQLTLELWTWLDDPALTPTFDTDHLVFVPTDDSAIVTLPEGSQSETQGKQLGVADQLGAPASDPAFSAGSVKGSAIRLNAVNEACGWGSITNGLYTGVANTVHVLEFDLNVNRNGAAGAITVLCELANLTDNTIDGVISAVATSSGGGALGIVGGRTTLALVVADVAAKKYQPRVRVTVRSSPAYVDVEAIRVSSLTYVAQNAKVRSDPGSLPSRAAVEQLDSSGNLGLAMDSTGTPFWLPPGLSLLYVNAFDVPTTGYNENKSDLTSGAKRTMTVTPTLYPRYWQ